MRRRRRSSSVRRGLKVGFRWGLSATCGLGLIYLTGLIGLNWTLVYVALIGLLIVAWAGAVLALDWWEGRL
jgi:hypothetical protein